MSDLSISFSPDSLKQITAYAGFPVLLSAEVQAAMGQGGQIIVSASRAAMHWRNPTGQLSANMYVRADSPFEIIVGNDLPYALRRHEGFSGMTDSLGRFYPHDPGQPYLQQPMDDNEPAILNLLDAGVEKALERMTGGA